MASDAPAVLVVFPTRFLLLQKKSYGHFTTASGARRGLYQCFAQKTSRLTTAAGGFLLPLRDKLPQIKIPSSALIYNCRLAHAVNTVNLACWPVIISYPYRLRQRVPLLGIFMELRCPAGNLQALKAAIDNVVEAVYIGQKVISTPDISPDSILPISAYRMPSAI